MAGQHPLVGALVQVTGGTGRGTTATTDAFGQYSLSLLPGTAAISVTFQGYVPIEQSGPIFPPVSTPSHATVTVTPAARSIQDLALFTTTTTVAMPQQGSQWELTGTVIDGAGKPVIGAGIDIPSSESLIWGTSTDLAGHFHVQTTDVLPPGGNTITAYLDGYVTQRVSFACCGAAPVAVTIRMPKVASVGLSGPAAISVGQAVQITATVHLDDGTVLQTTPLFLQFGQSNNLKNSTRGPGIIEATAAGTGTVFWSYYGTVGLLTITVN